jgi:carbamoylphosphate synthase small subunit
VNGFLLLEDGTVFRGESVGAEGYAFGEAVFTTAMTGYQEVVTDPSYADQIVCFTAAMVGTTASRRLAPNPRAPMPAPSSCARRAARRGRTGSTTRASSR